MSEKKTKTATTKKTKAEVDTKAFIERKLAVLNQKNGARFETCAARVIQNNKGAK